MKKEGEKRERRKVREKQKKTEVDTHRETDRENGERERDGGGNSISMQIIDFIGHNVYFHCAL